MQYSLRAVDPAGTMPGDGLLDEYADLSANITFTDVGDVQFQYPVKGANFSKLTQQRELALFDETGEVADTRFVIEDRNGNLVSRDGALYQSFQGRNLWKVFQEAIVYPSDWPAVPSVTAGQEFVNATPGQILSSFINASQGRGELPNITYNFSTGTDSGSQAWTNTLSIKYEAGVNLLQVIQNLVDQGVIECKMVGRQFQVYNAGGLGVDRTVTNPPFVLWAGDKVEEVPEQEYSRDLRNAALVRGDDNVFIEKSDATSIAAYGRRAVYISQAGIRDDGTLNVLAQLTIDKMKNPKRERTTAFSIDATNAPMRMFNPGDWIFSDGGAGLEKMRVRQIIVRASNSGSHAKATVVLNDRLMELEIALARKIEGITGAATQGGSTGGVPSPPSSAPDTLLPKYPAGLSVTSTAYYDASGTLYAAVHASYLQVTQNEDNSAIDDLENYVMSWRYTTGSEWKIHWANNQATDIYWSEVLPNREIAVRVGTYDTSGNFSGWSPEFTHTTANDATPPEAPSAPELSNFVGVVRCRWDGKDWAGAAMPSDFDHLEVHVSVINGFTPDATTLYDRLPTAGVSVISGQPYSQPSFVKFIAVDKTGNKSAASAQSSIVVEEVVSSEIFDEAITATKLAANSVTETKVSSGSISTPKIQAGAITAASGILADAVIVTAKIANLAVNDAKIGNVSIGKLTAGSLTADLTVSSRIKTANTGARVELNTLGLQAFDSGGVKTVEILASSGAAYFKGTIDGSVVQASTFMTAQNTSTSRIEIRSQVSETVNGGIIYGFNNTVNVSYLALLDDFTLHKVNGPVTLYTANAALNLTAPDGVQIGAGHLSVFNAGHYIFTSYINMSADYPGNNPAWVLGQNGDNYGRWYSPAAHGHAYVPTSGTSDCPSLTFILGGSNSFPLHLYSLTQGASSTITRSSDGHTIQVSGSALRLKKDITDFDLDIDALRKIKPVWYRWNNERDDVMSDDNFHGGFIADYVMEDFPEAVLFNPEGETTDIEDRALLAGAYRMIADLYQKVEALEAR